MTDTQVAQELQRQLQLPDHTLKIADTLDAYATDSPIMMTPHVREAIAAHLPHCMACRNKVDQLRHKHTHHRHQAKQGQRCAKILRSLARTKVLANLRPVTQSE